MADPPTKPKLLDQMRTAIRTRHYSIRTEQAYVQWVRWYVLYHNKRHPAELGEKEIAGFISHLAVKENVAAPTQNQALSAAFRTTRPSASGLTTRRHSYASSSKTLVANGIQKNAFGSYNMARSSTSVSPN